MREPRVDSDRHRSCLRRADRRLHEPDRLQERVAGARARPRCVRAGLGWLLARAGADASGQRRTHPAPVVRARDHAAGGRRPASAATGSTRRMRAGNVRAVVEAQMMSMALHSRWMGVDGRHDLRDRRRVGEPRHSAGDGRRLRRRRVSAGGGELGGARRGAARRSTPTCSPTVDALPWDEVIDGFVEPVAESRVHAGSAAARRCIGADAGLRRVRGACARARPGSGVRSSSGFRERVG